MVGKYLRRGGWEIFPYQESRHLTSHLGGGHMPVVGTVRCTWQRFVLGHKWHSTCGPGQYIIGLTNSRSPLPQCAHPWDVTWGDLILRRLYHKKTPPNVGTQPPSKRAEFFFVHYMTKYNGNMQSANWMLTFWFFWPKILLNLKLFVQLGLNLS